MNTRLLDTRISIPPNKNCIGSILKKMSIFINRNNNYPTIHCIFKFPLGI
ncbi:hypothetical protein SAMN04490181_3655 [Pseudomonas brenneri]|uniref:Uncharacterized protein n=1 Tax=Pseudomonas brenneri TaxID=129817 RepID=A0ABY0WIZ0_9PSED|nr:hypothetical protein SAMN04490181_3655 [Pseudomonas brenneri]